MAGGCTSTFQFKYGDYAHWKQEVSTFEKMLSSLALTTQYDTDIKSFTYADTKIFVQ